MTTPPTVLAPRAPGDTLAVRFISEGGQKATELAGLIAQFIAKAEQSLALAVYDCRLDETVAGPIRSALLDRLRAGVDVRLVYDDSKKKPQTSGQFNQIGGDFGVDDTHERVRELGLPPDSIRAVQGEGLMHEKFIVRDNEAVWCGTMNWSNDSMSRMENTLVSLISKPMADYFRQDFEQLWTTGHTTGTGNFHTNPVTLRYAGTDAEVDVDFSPGQGEFINEWVARKVLQAKQRIIFCSMLINSSKLLNALMTLLDRENLELWGVYDRTQMDGVLHQWHGQPQLQWKTEAIHRLLREAELVGKQSLPYRPGHSHNFMHNKLLIVDDIVITGSYNLSHAAQANAENMLAITSPALAENAIDYVRMLRNQFLGNRRDPD